MAQQSSKDIDIKPMVEHFRKQVRVINHSFVTYNWAPRPDAPASNVWFWQTPPPAPPVDPDIETPFSKIQRLAESFWRNYGAPGSDGNMYGYGLYTSVDPVSTHDYGGPRWRLTEYRFPVGTRLLDLDNKALIDKSDDQMSQATMEIERYFKCPVSLEANAYLEKGGDKLPPSCADLVYRVFNTELEVDALAYAYSNTQFKECGTDYNSQARAFVMMRSGWIKPENVRVYTADLKGREADRIRIQTIFLRSTELGALVFGYSPPFKEMIAEHLDRFPDRDFVGARTKCEGDACVISVKFCDTSHHCDEMQLPPIPRPGGPLITKAEAERTVLLWPDLIGKPKSTTILEWLKTNKFGCSGQYPYQNGGQ